MYYKVKLDSKMNLHNVCQGQTHAWRRANMKASVNETVLSPSSRQSFMLREMGCGTGDWRIGPPTKSKPVGRDCGIVQVFRSLRQSCEMTSIIGIVVRFDYKGDPLISHNHLRLEK